MKIFYAGAFAILGFIALYYVLPRYVWISHGYIGFNELREQYQKSNQPTFSIIMPTYNRAAFLPRSIASVQGQTFTDFELIIIDDGSTDNTEEIVRRFEKNDPRIVYIKSDKNYGVSHARNVGMKAAKGKYLTMLDSDDMIFPPLLATQYNYLKEHPDADVVTVKTYNLHDDGSVVWRYSPIMDTVMFLIENRMIHIGATIRKSFIDEHQIEFDENWRTTEDYKFYAELLMQGAQFHAIDQYLVATRYHHTHRESYYNEMEKHADFVTVLMKQHFSPETDNLCSYIKDIEAKQYKQFNKYDIMHAKILFCPSDFVGNYYILRREDGNERILLREFDNYFCEVKSRECGIVTEQQAEYFENKKCINIQWDHAEQEKLCTTVSAEYWK